MNEVGVLRVGFRVLVFRFRFWGFRVSFLVLDLGAQGLRCWVQDFETIMAKQMHGK